MRRKNAGGSGREQSGQDLSRRKSTRKPYKRVLIVCEGTKTEPNYFQELRKKYDLNPQNMIIAGKGADPLSVVDAALEKFKKDDSYDTVYCVFDKDEHPSYQKALDKIKQNKTKKSSSIPIHGIYSVPSFEYWLLLHFEDSLKPYSRTGNKSPAEHVISDLKKYLTNDMKGDQSTFKNTEKYLEEALNRAERNDAQQEKNLSDNPLTKVYLLIKDIASMGEDVTNKS